MATSIRQQPVELVGNLALDAAAGSAGVVSHNFKKSTGPS